MGCSPKSLPLMQKYLLQRPHAIIWSPRRRVRLLRGPTKKLGFHFKTVSLGEDETVTVIVLIKGDCCVEEGDLHVGDRIVSIDGSSITGYNEVQVKHVLSQQHDSPVYLEVCTMIRADPNTQVKRFLSENSSSSGGSVTASVSSAERPKVRRCALNIGTETPPVTSALTDLDLHAGGYTKSPPDLNLPGGGYTGSLPDLHLPRGRFTGFQLDTPALRTDIGSSQACCVSQPASSKVHSLPARMEEDIILTDDIVLSEAPSVGSTGWRSLGVDVCRAPGCSAQKMCLWHSFVLKFPQYVIWEAFTKTVLLDKNNGSSSFGFKYKVKKHEGPPAELFALVTEVSCGGVAWTQLFPGDWIRSINNTPVNSAKEAPDFRSLSSLRLVIQRPESLSPKGNPRLTQLARSMRLNLPLPPPPSTSTLVPQPLQAELEGRHRLNSQTSVSAEQRFVMSGDWRFGGSDGNCPGSPSYKDPMLEQYPRLAQSPGEYIPLNTLSAAPPPLPERQVLPWVRLLVCGADGSAADFARGLVGECSQLVVDPAAMVHTFSLSLHVGPDFGAVLHSQPESVTALLQEWETRVQRAGGCAGDGAVSLRAINLELYVINSEEFYHHCCSWLLPTCSLVFFTFHVHKLLNSPQRETSRLGAMVHSLLACTDGGRPSTAPAIQVLMYGVPSGPHNDGSIEEVQTSFYLTDCGSRLLEQYGLAVTQPSCGASMARVRSQLFSACQNYVYHTSFPHSVIRTVDVLSSISAVKVGEQEVSNIVSQAVGDTEAVSAQSVLHSLLAAGRLIPCRGCGAGTDGTEQTYLLPFNLCQALVSLLVKPDMDSHSPDHRQKWFKLISTGRASRSELQDMFSSEADTLTVDLLVCLGIAFKFQSSSSRCPTDSGFSEDQVWEYITPYFLMEAGGDVKEGEGTRFVLKFDSYLSWTGYFDMLAKVSGLPATEDLRVHDQRHCTIKHNGLELSLHRRKDWDNDSVLVTTTRLDRRGETVTAQQLERLFRSVIAPSSSFKLYPLEEALPPSNLPSPSAECTPVGHLAPTLSSAHEEHRETAVKSGAQMQQSKAERTARCGPYKAALTSLPWSVLNQAAILLSVHMPTGHNWKSVAERTGKSMAEIYAYETICSEELPAMNFLREWMITGTVQRFLDILEEIDRPDVRNMILNHLSEQSSKP